MATNFSPCKGSYVLNQFPSNVMFGMNGFHVSASGAIQGHHGPLVCLHNAVCICDQIFIKLAQFIYSINILNPIDFEKNLTISKGKVAILSL